MIDDPVDPLRSPFAPSFLAAYRCASHILLSIKEQFDLLPELCSRFWATWTYAFSAAVRLFVYASFSFFIDTFIEDCIWDDCYERTDFEYGANGHDGTGPGV